MMVQALAIVCFGSLVSLLFGKLAPSGPQMLRRQWQLFMSRHVQQVCWVSSWSTPRLTPSSTMSLTTGSTMGLTILTPTLWLQRLLKSQNKYACKCTISVCLGCFYLRIRIRMRIRIGIRIRIRIL